MRNAAVIVVALAACQASSADPKTPAAADKLDEHARLGKPITVESLTVIPIVSTDAANPKEPDLITLDEAFPKKLVTIAEVNGGDVNQLALANKSDQPLFLMAGEVIIGGKQDRIIGSNTIIPAKSAQNVPVFCVEHGRWHGESSEFTTANALAHGRLRERASFEGQQAVWDEVAEKNKARKTTTDTDTYRHVAEQQQDAAMGKWKTQLDDALGKLDADDKKNLVGFAVALNGKVATVDRFGSPKLFAKLQGKLVKSYITEAIDLKATKDAKAVGATEVKGFIADAEKAKTEAAYETATANTASKKGAHASKSSVEYKPAKNGKVEVDAPVAAPVYQTYQSNQ